MAITKVTSGGIKDSAITSAKIADGTIANTDISTTAAIPSSKLDHGTSSEKVVRLDGFGALPAVDGSNLLNVTTDITGKVDKISWTHAAGSVGTFNEEGNIGTIALGGVSGVDGSAMTASNTTSLPAGLSLSSGGSLTGTLSNLTSNTTSSFTVSLTDGTNTDTRTFSITNTADNDAPVWSTTAGALAPASGSGYSVQLSATDPEGGTITYTKTSGTLPPGLTVNTSGLISGTATTLDGTNHSFTIRATDVESTYADRSFSIIDKAPTLYEASTGGTISTYSDGVTNYKVHTFTTSGTFVAGGDGTADIMIIGGGGGSNATHGGGSGAGGMVYKQNEAFSAGNYTVVVGAGSVSQGEGRPGSDTDFKGLEAIGGGGSSRDGGGIAAGYNYEQMGKGGCGSGTFHNTGGGGAYQRSRPGDSGTYGFGFNADGGHWASHGGGGGGGIGAEGGNPTSKGGDGLQEGTSITYSDSSTVTFGFDGTGDWYGIGGSGGQHSGGCTGSTAPNHGGAACGSSGAVNTGNGGGAGGQGGSGICIIRYAV